MTAKIPAQAILGGSLGGALGGGALLCCTCGCCWYWRRRRARARESEDEESERPRRKKRGKKEEKNGGKKSGKNDGKKKGKNEGRKDEKKERRRSSSDGDSEVRKKKRCRVKQSLLKRSGRSGWISRGLMDKTYVPGYSTLLRSGIVICAGCQTRPAYRGSSRQCPQGPGVLSPLTVIGLKTF